MLNILLPMSWTVDNEKYSQIIKGANHLDICGANGDFLTIRVGAPIAQASWLGEDILVRLQNGETRQYLDTRHYLILPEPKKSRIWSFFKSLFGKFSHGLPQPVNRSAGEFKLNPPAGITR